VTCALGARIASLPGPQPRQRPIYRATCTNSPDRRPTRHAQQLNRTMPGLQPGPFRQVPQISLPPMRSLGPRGSVRGGQGQACCSWVQADIRQAGTGCKTHDCHRDMSSQMSVSDFFNEEYRSMPRYWWRDKVRYAPEADAYPSSLLTQMTLRLIEGQPPGRVLDIGAGEGADSIRLALLGYDVDAVEISAVAAEKTLAFAEQAGVTVNVNVADIVSYEPNGPFDIVICNGVLQYIEDKEAVIELMQTTTRTGGINVISLWSTYTDVPECHKRVPVFCDDEDGLVVNSYKGWIQQLLYFERDKREDSHSGMPPHSHSHIKLIVRKP